MEFQKSHILFSRKTPRGSSSSKKLVNTSCYDLREIYDLFEKDFKGANFDRKISVRHFKMILKTFSLDGFPNDLNELVQKFDPNREGFVCLSALNELVTMSRKRKSSDSDLTLAFNLLDKDSKGFISIQDLRRVNADLPEKLTEEELEEMIEEIDSETGIVSLEKFIEFMNKAEEDAIKCNC